MLLFISVPEELGLHCDTLILYTTNVRLNGNYSTDVILMFTLDTCPRLFCVL